MNTQTRLTEIIFVSLFSADSLKNLMILSCASLFLHNVSYHSQGCVLVCYSVVYSYSHLEVASQ